METLEITRKEKNRLWIARVFGILLSVALMAFLVLYYLKYIDGNMFALGMLGFGSLIMVTSSQFMTVKSTPFWTFFSLAVAAVFAVAFLIFLAYLIANGVLQI